jgi:hypothetical protein
MTMQTPIPNPDEELASIAPVVPVLYEGFEAATESACQYFENKDRSVDPSLFPHIVRYEVGEYLKDRTGVVVDLTQEELANNGLSIVVNDRHIRIWKGEDDRIPPPGGSKARIQFLNQQLALFDIQGELRAVDRNLVILWSVDNQHRLEALCLVCPKWAASNGLVVQNHWARTLEHPAQTPLAVVPPTPDQSQEPKDLPLRLAENKEPQRAEGAQ